MLDAVSIGCRAQPNRTTSQPSGSDSTNAIATGTSASQMCWSKRVEHGLAVDLEVLAHLGEEVHVSRPHAARLGGPARLPRRMCSASVPCRHQPVGAALAVDAYGGARPARGSPGRRRCAGCRTSSSVPSVGSVPSGLFQPRGRRSPSSSRVSPSTSVSTGSTSRSAADSKDRPRKPRSRPTKLRTKSSAGAASSSSGAATWASRPPSANTATWSPSLTASSMSWVTSTMVLPMSCCSRRNSCCRLCAHHGVDGARTARPSASPAGRRPGRGRRRRAAAGRRRAAPGSGRRARGRGRPAPAARAPSVRASRRLVPDSTGTVATLSTTVRCRKRPAAWMT